MIDEKKLIECLAYDISCFDELKGKDLSKTYVSVADMVRMICGQPKIGGWIPCSERMPENDGYILLSFENLAVPMVGRYEEDDAGGAFYAVDGAESCISQDMIVNAWMPLPQPYTADHQDT
ncbi:MAG: DUF551 domain-containing protein [Lachnospiraceae bacterium]|nr:DUF551 domain-containing protein [Lachnospiraceae bacterium]MCM1239972.1 DUF551 domain-containing protein [Lachnospiraceae bacterium]